MFKKSGKSLEAAQNLLSINELIYFRFFCPEITALCDIHTNGVGSDCVASDEEWGQIVTIHIAEIAFFGVSLDLSTGSSLFVRYFQRDFQQTRDCNNKGFVDR